MNKLSENKEREIYVIGHQNPDTDSICSAIALAALRNAESAGQVGATPVPGYLSGLVEKAKYIPCRAGHLNQETKYVLKTFGFKPPMFMNDVRTQIRDIDYSTVEPAAPGISLRQAWKTMRRVEKSTLAITDPEGKLQGVITTSIIARSYMSVFDTTVLGDAQTPYTNVLDTLEGKMVVGEESGFISGGKIVIAAANMDLMRENIDEGDVVILGNRYEAQLCAIEEKASAIIVCEAANVSRTICKIAAETGCRIISTPYDAYTAARMINLSMPIGYFMKKDPVSFDENAFVDDIRTTMTKVRYRDFPITRGDGIYAGMMSRRNLIDIEGKRLIMVDHNEIGQAAAGIDQAEIMEIVDHHKLSTIGTIKPINVRNLPLGCTATIIYQMYLHRELPVPKEIAGLLCSAIISDTLLFRSPTCTETDKQAVAALAAIAGIDPEEHARAMFDAGSDLGSKSLEDIFYMDFKKFKSGDVSFGVGQITSTNKYKIDELKESMKTFLEEARKREGTDMVFFLLTDIFSEHSWVVFSGSGAQDLLSEGFALKIKDNEVLLEGVVSRKKQFVPVIMEQINA